MLLCSMLEINDVVLYCIVCRKTDVANGHQLVEITWFIAQAFILDMEY